MVEPIRKSVIDYKSRHLIDGLFVVGDSTCSENDIPHLPTIGAKNPIAGVPNFEITTDSNDLSSESVYCSELFSVFDEGDIVWLNSKSKTIHSVLTKKANANTLLVTERCDNRCDFCSQPPNDKADELLYENAALSILNFNSESFVGISGGEPTFNRSAFLTLLETLQIYNNKTPLHILTNGRSFSDSEYLNKVMKTVTDKSIVWGIPLYGHKNSIHDSLVGSKDAFKETVEGILNLSNYGQYIELRIIPVKENIKTLPRIIDFIVSSLPNVSVISIMNLEPIGWAKYNYNSLHVDVEKQVEYLQSAVMLSEVHGIDIRLFNYPLCLISDELQHYACQSISDWKNYYAKECETCSLKPNCCGFFTSAKGKFIEIVEAVS